MAGSGAVYLPNTCCGLLLDWLSLLKRAATTSYAMMHEHHGSFCVLAPQVVSEIRRNAERQGEKQRTSRTTLNRLPMLG